MELKELLKFIELQDGRLKRYYNIDKDKQILARAVKLAEEVGELSNEVLAHSSLQSKDKLEKIDKTNLSVEFADVIITTLLLAKAMDVDIESAIDNKVAKLNKKYGKV